MNLLPLQQLGGRELQNNRLKFGILLPWVSAQDGNKLYVKIIHEDDQFLQGVQPRRFELQHRAGIGTNGQTYSDYWSGVFEIAHTDDQPRESKWGQPGKYVYRYELESPLLDEPLDWIIDPFAREFGIGRQAAITLGYEDFDWGESEDAWKTPRLTDLIVYEMMLSEFAEDIDAAIEKLPYLKDLGINCIEIMPLSNVDRSINWGYEPIGHFGLDERFGERKNFQRLVKRAHELGVAVIVDMVYGHTGGQFAYEYVYSSLKYRENPFMGAFAQNSFGPSTDFNKKLTQDFYFSVNRFWLDKFHVDGIRYDCVPNYYDGCYGAGYANLVYNTYQMVKNTNGAGHWQRFFDPEGGAKRINLIQCAEHLDNPQEIVKQTYSSASWQNQTYQAACSVAHGNFSEIYDLGMRLGLDGYPAQVTHNGDTLEKSAFQYFENHDHSRFVCCFGISCDEKNLFREGVRDNWFKLQPYAIALLLAKGIPMLWEGQEILENYYVPEDGSSRVGTIRPVRWEYFYSNEGKNMIRLYRKVLALRNEEEIFRRGEYYFYNDWNKYQGKGLLVFSRKLGGKSAIVALNFSDADQYAEISFDAEGDYVELLHGADNLRGVNSGESRVLMIPGNYGKVWMNS